MTRRAVWGVAVLIALVGSWLLFVGEGGTGHSAARPRSATSGPRSDLFGALADPHRIGEFGHGAWSWFQDPRVLHVGGPEGPTYAGWIAWDGAITVGSYNPLSGVVRTHVVGYWIHDDHASPVIFREPDGRLTVFWSGHNGHVMNYRTTRRPLEIRAWGPLHRLDARLTGDLGFTYPNPVLLPAEHDKLYLFWRGASWSTDYMTRTPDGRWGAPHVLIAVPGQRPYVKVASNGNDEIGLAFTNAHPRDTFTSVYYAAYRRGAVWTAGGRRIAEAGHAPIAPGQADRVYDGPAARAASWVWDVAFAHDGDPVIAYATFPLVRDDSYWYARWDDRRWVSHFLTHGGPSISPGTLETEYSGGMALDHADPSVVYLSKKLGRWFVIQRWVSADGGYRWRHATAVAGAGDAVRPVVPRGADGPVRLAWMGGPYGRYIHYRTSIRFLTGTG